VGVLRVGDGAGRAEVRCDPIWQGGQRIAHGGWVAAVLDDVVGRTLAAQGTFVVTSELAVEYLRPTPVDEDLFVTTEARPDGDRRWRVTASLHMRKAPEQPLARANALMIEPRSGHYERQKQKMAALRGSDAEDR